LRKTIARLTREPLIHFVLIGASIYGLYGIFGQQETADQDRSIVITAGEIGWLEASWEKRWNRPPTPAERQGLIKQYTRETVLYREALAMGLDQDDTIIRRRLAQKLEFLSKDLIRPDPPGDKELQAYFEAHIDRYRPPDLLTMTQIFLDPDKRGERTLDDAESLKAELIALKVPTAASRDPGDPFMLQSYYPERSEAELGKLFGSEFAQSVFALEPAQWHGPVLSGYGVHLVYVHQRQEASPPTFSQVVERVRQDWEDDKGKELNEAFIARLLARYDVIIEDVAPGGAAAGLEEKPQ
jgi:peptidyl-prolyl cis-trans isomerase C